MRYRFCFFYFLILISTIHLSGQITGYQGKRFLINYSQYFSLAIANPNVNNNSGWRSFNYYCEIEPEYVIGNKNTFGLNAGYTKTSFSYDKFFESKGMLNGREVNQYDFEKSVFGKITLFSTGFFFRHFFNGNIAPLGTYLKFGANWLHYTIDPGDPRMANGWPLDETPFEVHNDPSYNTWLVNLEVGQTRIFFKRLLLDYGLKMSFNPGAIKRLSPGFDAHTRDFYKEISLRRINSFSFLSAKVGIGILL